MPYYLSNDYSVIPVLKNSKFCYLAVDKYHKMIYQKSMFDNDDDYEIITNEPLPKWGTFTVIKRLIPKSSNNLKALISGKQIYLGQGQYVVFGNPNINHISTNNYKVFLKYNLIIIFNESTS